MNAIAWLNESLSIRLTVTLVHFLWQGCAVALIVVLAGRLLKRASAQTRYAINVAAMLAMVACLPLTFSLVENPPQPTAASEDELDAAHTPAAFGADAVSAGEGTPLALDKFEAQNNRRETVAAAQHTSDASIASIDNRDRAEPESGTQSFVMWPRRNAACLTALYLVGVALMIFRLGMGLRGSRKLRRSAVPVWDDDLLATVARQARRIGLRAAPAVAFCRQISVPIVVGIIKPMVLLPATLASGLSPDQLQALITHELAHIRRFDLLVNLLQRLIEAVLFFHPAVWFLSRRISTERENATDDAVLAAGWQRINYADALVRMAELSCSLRGTRINNPAALAASGRSVSEFKRRVLRLVGGVERPQLRLTRWGLTMFVAVLAFAALSPVLLHAFAQSKDVQRRGAPNQKPAPAKKKRDSVKTEKPDASIMKSSGWKIHGLIHPAHVQMVWCVAFSPDGKTIASAGADKTVKLWDVATERLLKTIKRPFVNCTSVAFSPNGKLLAIAGGDDGRKPRGEVVLWDITADKIRFVIQNRKQTKYVKSVCFSPDGKWLASGGSDNHVMLWSVATGKLRNKLVGHTARVYQVTFSPDGKTLATSSFDRTVRLWDVLTGAMVATLKGHSEEVRGIAFSPDGRKLVSTSDDKTARVWDVAAKKQIGILKDAHNGAIFSVAFAPDGRHVVTGGKRGSMGLMVWDVTTQNWRDPVVFPVQSSPIPSLAFSPDGRMLAIVGGWNSFQIWKRRPRGKKTAKGR